MRRKHPTRERSERYCKITAVETHTLGSVVGSEEMGCVEVGGIVLGCFVVGSIVTTSVLGSIVLEG